MAMARLARVVVPGVAHHVTQRGNRHQDVFLQEGDRQMYLRLLKERAAKHKLRVVGYCLMTNHVHLIVVPEQADSLAKALGRTHNEYARWLHIRQSMSGHLWQNRFYSCPLDPSHLWAALRYVELNPVRANLVRFPWEWPWSSARAHCTGSDVLGMLDWRLWAASYSPATWREALMMGVTEAAFLERIRDATRTGRPLGGPDFIQDLEARVGRRLRPGKRGPRPRAKPLELQLKLGVA